MLAGILSIIIVSVVARVKLAIYFKYYMHDDFSLWNHHGLTRILTRTGPIWTSN